MQSESIVFKVNTSDLNRKATDLHLTNFLKCSITLVLLFFGAKHSKGQNQGKPLIDSLLRVIPYAKGDTNKVTVLNRVGSLYISVEPNEGIKFASSGLDLARKLNWEEGIAKSYNIIGACYFYKADYSQSIDYWNRALTIFRQLHNEKGILKIVGNIGLVYESQGDYSQALENNLLALKSAEELDDKISQGINLGNIGADYEYLKDYEKALEYDLKALKIEEELRDTQKLANVLCNIGNNYCDQHKYPQALQYQTKALMYNERIGHNYGIALNNENIGVIYEETQEYDKALEYLFKALEISKKSGIKATEANALSLTGEVLMAMDTTKNFLHARIPNGIARNYSLSPGNRPLLAAAIEYLNKSIAINIEINDLNELQHNYHSLSEAQSLAGEYKDALTSNNKYMSIKDSVFSMHSKIKITNLETQREIGLKNKQLQIDQLEVEKKQNIQTGLVAGIVLLLFVIVIGFRNLKLAAAKELSENKLNAFQARMNPHFIFNSFNSIQSLMLNNEIIPSIKYLSEFSKLMRQILDSSAKNKVLLHEEIQMLKSYITLEQLRYNNFTWDIIIAENVDENNVFVPGMIIQPFVENAIVHGFQPDRKDWQLQISFERQDKQIICTVDDNGIGREQSYELNKERNKDRQAYGTNIAMSRLALLNHKKKGLVNKVIYADKKENGIATGTKVTIQIPIL